MTRAADRARDDGEYRLAAILYQEAITKYGASKGILMQLGNSLKDSGSFDESFAIYDKVWASDSTDPDVALQIGHLNKLRGNLDEARRWYAKSVEIDGGDDNNPARKELEATSAGGGSHPMEVGGIEIGGLGFYESALRRRLIQQLRLRPH